MHSKIRALIDDARALLRTYTLALNTSGQEIIELLDAGVAHQKVAHLYPHEPAEWRNGVERLTRAAEPELRTLLHLDGTKEQRMQRRQIYPAALTKNGYLVCRSLTRNLSPEIPYFTEAQRAAYRRIGKVMPTGDDSTKHTFLLIMLLHILATSPAAATELKDSKVRRYARTTLIAAEALAQDPLFAAPAAEPAAASLI